jgi:hypothetical protein
LIDVDDFFAASVLADKLPGTWRFAATNLPMWVDGTRHDPEFAFEPVYGRELTFTSTVRYTTIGGEAKTIVGSDLLRGDEFVRRGRGWLATSTSRWRVAGANDDFEIVAIRYSRSRLTPEGIDVLVRKEATLPAVRSTVAHANEQFGLTTEDFASLTWLE